MRNIQFISLSPCFALKKDCDRKQQILRSKLTVLFTMGRLNHSSGGIPAELLTQVEKAIEKLRLITYERIDVIVESLTRLREHSTSPEIQIQCISRLTGVYKDSQSPHTAATRQCSELLMYEILVPFLLDFRVRYLHRGMMTLLRSLGEAASHVNAEAIKASFLGSLHTVCSEQRGNTSEEEEQLSSGTVALKPHEEPVMMFLNNVDCLSSTLMPLQPSVFIDTFRTVVPLLGDALRWCVFSATKEATDSTGADSQPAAVFGEDLDKIRFCVRVVASYLHRYLDGAKVDGLTPQLLRLMQPTVFMLSSNQFPKDVLNAAAILFISIATVRHCSEEGLGTLCARICAEEVHGGSALKQSITEALEVVVDCFCSSDQRRMLLPCGSSAQPAIAIIGDSFTTHGRFAVLKAILAHFSSPVHGSERSLNFLLRPLHTAAGQQITSSILFDLVLPFSQKHCLTVEQPETRFMAFQTLDSAVRHLSAVLTHLRRLVDSSTSEWMPLCYECIDGENIERLIELVTQLTLDVWDDNTMQVTGALYDTYGLILAVRESLSTFHEQFPELRRSSVPSVGIQSTLKNILLIQNDRRGKYHALLGLMTAMKWRDFYQGLTNHFLDERSNESDDSNQRDAVSLFCKSLLSGAANHKIANVSGDTMTTLVSKITSADDFSESERAKWLQSLFLAVAHALLVKGYVQTSSNVSEATHISHISAHFVVPLLKQHKDNLDRILDAFTSVQATVSPLDGNRSSQCVLEILTRARASNIDIERYLKDGSMTKRIVLSSLQNQNFDHRMLALRLCILSPKQSELAELWQATILEQFLMLNLHLGGDSISRKRLMETTNEWLNRIVKSFQNASGKAKSSTQRGKKNKVEEATEDTNTSEAYLQNLIIPHVRHLVGLLACNIGTTVPTSKGLSVERKVVACTCYASLVNAMKAHPRLSESLQLYLFEPSVVGPLFALLSDGWAQMRCAAKNLLQLFVRESPATVALARQLSNGENSLSDLSLDCFGKIKTASTLRTGEGATYAYLIYQQLEGLSKGLTNTASVTCVNESLSCVNDLCEAMSKLHGPSLFAFVKANPLHGLLCLTSEVLDTVSGGAADIVNGLFSSTSKVIQVCGSLAGSDVTEDEAVDCRGHLYGKDGGDEADMRRVVNNVWLAAAAATSCVQKAMKKVDIAHTDYPTVRQLCYDLVNCLLLTKHNGVMRCVRSALKSLMHILLRSKATVFYQLPSELLHFLLGPNGVTSLDLSRMLRRSQGLPHAILAVLEAEDDSTPLVLFPRTMKILLSISSATEEGTSDAAHLSQRSNALNVLKFIFEDKRFGERVISDVEAAFAIATSGFRHSSWNIRNSSLMLFSSVLHRFVGEHPSKGGGGSNTSLHDITKRTPKGMAYTYQVLKKGSSTGGDEDLSLFPLLQMLSMLSPDPLHLPPNTAGFSLHDVVSAVMNCGRSDNLMIRSVSAVALPCLVHPANIPHVITELSQKVMAVDVDCNQIHGSLLQLQEFYKSYLGTIRRQCRRAIRNAYADKESMSHVAKTVEDCLLRCLPVISSAARRCATICCSLLLLSVDIVHAHLISRELPSNDACTSRLLETGCILASLALEPHSPLFQQCGAEQASTMEAAAQLVILALLGHTQLTPRAVSALSTCIAHERNVNVEESASRFHSFSGVLAHQLCRFLSEHTISETQWVEVVNRLEKEFSFRLLDTAIATVSNGTPHIGHLRSWQLVNQANHLEFLCTMWGQKHISILPALQHSLLDALASCATKSSHVHPRWGSAAMVLLAMMARQQKIIPTALLSSLECFSLPDAPQDLRSCALNALAELLHLVNLKSPVERVRRDGAAILLLLLRFLLDDSFEVRERASTICCLTLLEREGAVRKDHASCALAAVHALRMLASRGDVDAAQVSGCLSSAAPTDGDDDDDDDDENDEDEVLFHKESDNVYIERTLGGYYTLLMFPSSKTPTSESDVWLHMMDAMVMESDAKDHILPTVSPAFSL